MAVGAGPRPRPRAPRGRACTASSTCRGRRARGRSAPERRRAGPMCGRRPSPRPRRCRCRRWPQPSAGTRDAPAAADDVDRRSARRAPASSAGGAARSPVSPVASTPATVHAGQDAARVVAIERQRTEPRPSATTSRTSRTTTATGRGRMRMRCMRRGRGSVTDVTAMANSPNSRHPARRRARDPGGPTRSCRRAHGALCPRPDASGRAPARAKARRGGYDAAGRSGGTGRRGGLKIRCPQGRPSSNLGSGTTSAVLHCCMFRRRCPDLLGTLASSDYVADRRVRRRQATSATRTTSRRQTPSHAERGRG